MESTTVLSIAAVVCFVVYYEMVTSSYIEHVSTRGVLVSGVFYPTCVAVYCVILHRCNNKNLLFDLFILFSSFNHIHFLCTGN